MLDYAALQALAAVVREGSFERAARRLHVTPSAISQRIKLLEERTGTVLVLRGPPCTGTEAGRRLCLHVEQVELLEAALRRSNPALVPDAPAMAPTLRLAVNADSLDTWFLDATAAFTAGGPELLDLSIDDQDHTAQRLREGEVLAAITSKNIPIAGCNSWPLGSMRYLATASPAFVARHLPQGLTPQALAQAPMLTFNRKDRLQAQWLMLQGLADKAPAPTHFLPSTSSFVRACEAGMGWGMHPEALVARPLARGTLVELRPGAPLDVPLHWVLLRSAQASLERLTQCVMAAAHRHLRAPAAA
jgi:LysR family transcriptional regulator (chromosome initiation inhibitor)